MSRLIDDVFWRSPWFVRRFVRDHYPMFFARSCVRDTIRRFGDLLDQLDD